MRTLVQVAYGRQPWATVGDCACQADAVRFAARRYGLGIQDCCLLQRHGVVHIGRMAIALVRTWESAD